MFNQRSPEKELMDADNIPQQDLFRNLFELERINTLLGGHAVTIKGLEQLRLKKDRTYSILDIGSGGGDTLKHIARWARKQNYKFELTGVDLKADCIQYATTHCSEYREINFIQDDYRNVVNGNQEYDIIITSLFCHHLSNTELSDLFFWGATHAKVGFIMNDLHRHPFAYYSIALLTKLFSKSYLVKNDAKLSVLRGFNKEELLHLLRPFAFQLKWKWAFRWLMVIRK
ncbi:MAG: methyltransferase domain-containing protein [Bacteroidota bacterium]